MAPDRRNPQPHDSLLFICGITILCVVYLCMLIGKYRLDYVILTILLRDFRAKHFFYYLFSTDGMRMTSPLFFVLLIYTQRSNLHRILKQKNDMGHLHYVYCLLSQYEATSPSNSVTSTQCPFPILMPSWPSETIQLGKKYRLSPPPIW